jgi:hypothetical protein
VKAVPALLVVVVVALLLVSAGEAGHEITFYPSFYPQEITVRAVSPSVAAGLLGKNQLQAYVGRDPFAAGPPPPHVSYVDSLGAFVVLTFDRAAVADAGARCAAAARALRSLASVKTPFVFHPYPVTPYHEDYLVHVDLADAARKRIEPDAGVPALKVKAAGALAQAARQAGLKVVDAGADAALEAIERAPSTAPWRREGWFQAYQTYAGVVGEATTRAIEEAYTRHVTGASASPAERANLERRLVASLTRGCERVAVGYTRRREAINEEYSAGVENVAWDSQTGLGSAIFLRTVKLKDFPWNGWLTLGSEARPTAAWNPVAGFTDDTGRLVWAAVGDPALIAAPYNAGWIANRVEPGVVTTGSIDVPADAVLPDRATGALRPVGKGTTAAAKVTYRVLASAFHDETRMTAADVVYPFVFAVRRGVPDAGVERATAGVRDGLAAVKVVRMDVEVKELGDMQLLHHVALVEVYLKQAVDRRYAAEIAPPWSPVPWQLTVLMEEAVHRNVAAFSETEARRRGVPWLDVVRDAKTKAALASLAADFERRAYVPEGLRGLVTVEQARQRWAALRRFARLHGHWLVTNGPYRIAKWTPDTVVLTVFRDFSYPLGVGSYDRFALPLRAFPVKVERVGEGLLVQADVEVVEKSERSYKIVRQPFKPAPAGEQTMRAVGLVARYAVLGAGDEVVRVGESPALSGERLSVDLKGLKSGAYRVLLTVALNGNVVNPEVKVIPYRVAD